MGERINQRYWQIDAEEAPERRAQAIWSAATALQQDQQWRAQLNAEYIGTYEARQLTDLNASAYTRKQEKLDLSFNLARSLVETVVADTAGRQRPKPQFLTSGADWQTRRRAKRMDQLCEGMLHQPQGRFTDSWDLMVAAWRDCCVCDLGAVKVMVEDREVVAERVYAWELFVDPIEAEHGDPRTLFHLLTMDRDLALATFCGEDVDEDVAQARRFALESAEAIKDSSQMGPKLRAADQIQIVESWHLGIGDEEGHHDFALDGCLLHSEEWPWDCFPFVIYRWADDVIGWHGQSLVEECLAIQQELDQWAESFQENYLLRNGRRTYYEEDTVEETYLQANESETFVPVKAGAKLPVTDPTPPFTEADIKYGGLLKEWGYQFTGVSQQSATSQKEPGVTAAVAMRTLMDIGSKRFARKLTTFENGFITLARLFIRLAATIPGYKVKLPGHSTFTELDVSEVLIDEDKLQIRIRPASSLPDDPAGRLSLIQEMYSGGIIDAAMYKRLLDWPDMDALFSRENAEYEWLETLIDRFLDATPENADDVYESPEGFLFGKQSAMVQLGAAYFTAKREGAPERNLQLLRDYITELGEQIKEAEQAQAALMNGGPAPVAGSSGQAPPPGAAGPPLPPAPVGRAA